MPAIQRGLVWKPSQVELLWDSILRQFPIGAIILSCNKYNDKEIYDLIDGQQRWNAIASGYGTIGEKEKGEEKDCILWFDLMPEIVWKNVGTTRKYFIRATTKAHPWGYKANDECTTLNTREKQEALEKFLGKFEKKADQYKGEISLTETYPVESGFPVPLQWMISAGEKLGEKEFVDYIQNKIIGNDSREFLLKNAGEIDGNVIAKYYDAFHGLLRYEVPTIYIDQETINNESRNEDSWDKNNGEELSGIEILFNRIGTGGTRITESELMYSAVKAYWPELVEENDSLAKLYMPPHTLISLAFQLMLTTSEKGLGHAPSVRKIRQLALNDNDLRIKIDELYNTDGKKSIISRILANVDKWLTDKDGNGNHRIPPVLRTSIARNSPDVFLLLMIFSKWELDGRISPTVEDRQLFQAMAYYLHWMVNKKFAVANKIYQDVEGTPINEWKTIIKRILLEFCVEERNSIKPLVSLSSFRKLIPIEKSQGWRPWGNNRSGETWWPLWEIISSNREILLYAQRKYMCMIFSNYDPARQDLWADSNRPWDFDHIIPQDWIYKYKGRKQAFTDYCKAWKDNNGNIAAIPFWVNRSKSDSADWREYENHREMLLADDEIDRFKELFTHRITSDTDEATRFAYKTYNRLCKIYDAVYNLLEPVDFRVGEISFTKEGLKTRQGKMTDIIEGLKKVGLQGDIYYLRPWGDMERRLNNIDDWTSAWMSCGCLTANGYYAALTMSVHSNGKISEVIEIGLRRRPNETALSGAVTAEQLKELKDNEEYARTEDNSWWHIWKEISINTANEEIINEIKALADFASKNLQ